MLDLRKAAVLIIIRCLVWTQNLLTNLFEQHTILVHDSGIQIKTVAVTKANKNLFNYNVLTLFCPIRTKERSMIVLEPWVWTLLNAATGNSNSTWQILRDHQSGRCCSCALVYCHVVFAATVALVVVQRVAADIDKIMEKRVEIEAKEKRRGKQMKWTQRIQYALNQQEYHSVQYLLITSKLKELSNIWFRYRLHVDHDFKQQINVMRRIELPISFKTSVETSSKQFNKKLLLHSILRRFGILVHASPVSPVLRLFIDLLAPIILLFVRIAR
ncbi:hypothetical protein RB195_008014 [Necator americanus]|uniref:Uncharacterized protein n=1 Tax=Necator americanus TaxID=51031 RepID=A0ABR1C161_NECAM